MFNFKKEKGQLVLEVMIATTIFSLVGFTMIQLILFSFIGIRRGINQVKAQALSQEGIEAVRAVKNRDWDSLVAANYIAEDSAGEWVLSSGSEDQIGNFTRTISISDVYRDNNYNISESGSLDEYTKLVEVETEWETENGNLNSVKRTEYFTNWWFPQYDGYFSVSEFCESFGSYLSGSCHQNEQQCINDGGIHQSEGDAIYCLGGSDSDTACCYNDERSCSGYCVEEGYQDGDCVSNTGNCSGTYEGGGDPYCSGSGEKKYCCCAS